MTALQVVPQGSDEFLDLFWKAAGDTSFQMEMPMANGYQLLMRREGGRDQPVQCEFTILDSGAHMVGSIEQLLSLIKQAGDLKKDNKKNKIENQEN